METSVYYVKDALDANITYAAGPQVYTVDERDERQSEEEEEEEEDDVDTPDLGGHTFHTLSLTIILILFRALYKTPLSLSVQTTSLGRERGRRTCCLQVAMPSRSLPLTPPLTG